MDDEQDVFGYSDAFVHEKPAAIELDNSTDERFDKTFACYPEEYQQTALSRLRLIKFVERMIRGGWTQKNLEPILLEYRDKYSTPIPSWRILAGWKKIFYESGRDVKSLVPKHEKKGNKVKRLDSQHLVDEAINKKYLTRERVSIAQAYKYYKSRVIEENRKQPNNEIKALSKRTFYHRVDLLPQYDTDLARYGKKYADKKHRSVGKKINPTYPMEYVEIDHTPAPVIILDDDLLLPIGRPYLTILLDCYSSCIAGLFVTFREPSYSSVRAAFLNAVLEKDWVKQKYPNIKNDWPCFGKITNLVVDNGAEFWSDSLESALTPLVTDIIYNKKGKPWLKANVEKSFDIFYKQLFSKLPGKTFTNPTRLVDYDPKKDAVVTCSTFYELLHIWIIDTYHMESDARETRIPYHKWQEAKYRPNFYKGPEAEQLRIELGILNHRTIRTDGINLYGLRYQSPELIEYRKTCATEKKSYPYVATKTTPDDISYIYVFLPEEDKYIKVPAVDPDGYTKGLSLYIHLRVRANQRLNTRLLIDEESLADTHLYIDRRIDTEIDKLKGNKRKKTLPKTSHMSKIAKFKGLSSEGPTSITQNSKAKGPIVPEHNEENVSNIITTDFSGIKGY